ncbi:hypothetical protein [Hymenobacter rigui]|uniref:Outer membrane protein beta-barrel domain-containing protein n=1 Tax=Hymenobacter rigui TaxID=334424 RepID=A0A428KLB0_9BACT|nr:hypothetical protein [Hymenobacter rigui]RSK47183.1 hypothetical protein EI291_16455 [Hymenobacter rigui]
MINKYALLIAGIVMGSTAYGQDAPAAKQNLIRLGVGNSLNGSGDYQITKAHLEYAPQLGGHARLASRIAVITGSNHYNFGGGYTIPQSYRGVNLEQELHWLPFGANRIVEFGIGGGGFVGYAKTKSFSVAGFNEQQSFYYIPDNHAGLHIGYIASAYLDCALNQERTWRAGVRVALQNDTQANILPGGQFQLSHVW